MSILDMRHLPERASSVSAKRVEAAVTWGARVLLLVTLVCVFVPFLPAMPAGNLDPSWAYGMNQSVAQGLAFGKDMVFTFGPYASIYTMLFHPATDLLAIFGALYLAVMYACVVGMIAIERRWLLLAVCAALAALPYSRDALLFVYPLLVGVYCYRSSFVDDGGDKIAAPAMLFAPFGLLPLIKGSLLVLCGAIAVLSVLFLLAIGRRRSAASAVLAFLVSAVFFWVLAGQSAAGLPAYFLSMIPIVSGYTDAMSIAGPGREIVWYLGVSLLLMALVYTARHARPAGRVYISAVYAAYLFLAFKGGFVRHDLHAMMAGSALLLASLSAVPLLPSRSAVVVVVASALVCVGITRSYATVSPVRVAQNVQATYQLAWTGLEIRSQPARLRTEFERARTALNQQVQIPVMQGTTDIYAYQQSYLLSSGNTWSPRPVLQSYSAYTPALAEANREHLLGAGAPDNVVFRVETIDRRLPSGDDGASWPVLVSNYRPVASNDAFVLLRKVPGAMRPRQVAIGESDPLLGQVVSLPEHHGMLFVKIDLDHTLAGRLVNVFYKTSPLHMRLDLEDGTSRVYRIVPGIARAGLIISPLVENSGEFARLYSQEKPLQGKRVKAIVIAPADQVWHWQAKYHLTLMTFQPVYAK